MSDTTDGRVVLVTGGSRGIGRACATAFAELGAAGLAVAAVSGSVARRAGPAAPAARRPDKLLSELACLSREMCGPGPQAGGTLRRQDRAGMRRGFLVAVHHPDPHRRRRRQLHERHGQGHGNRFQATRRQGRWEDDLRHCEKLAQLK